jgi:predicted CxxxxCH...CXXCH cytochrome family protein
VTTGCTGCHGHSGSLAEVTHVDGPTVSIVTTAGQVTSFNGTDHNCTNTCHLAAGTDDWSLTGALACDDCHGASGKSLFRSRISGSHAAHYNSTPTLGDLGRSGNDSTSSYNYGCATCHPSDSHLNGSSRAVIAGVNYAGGAAGTCGTNSCHQNGNSGAPLATPTWGTPFTGDKCAKCHGNSPTSNAHGVHVIGIHATDIYSGTTGLLTTATATKSHGNAATSTTINCNVCHSTVVTSSANANNAACISCHTDSATPATGNAAATIANKQLHVDGSKQVMFSMATFKSKAQLRDDITAVTSLNSSWTRNDGYKSATSFDQAKVTPGPQWTAGSCSTVDCHNGQTATWTDSNVSCTYCHTSTPQ